MSIEVSNVLPSALRAGRRISEARIKAGITQRSLADALNRTQMWISLVERGKQRVSPEVEQKIFHAIECLGKFRTAVREGRRKIIDDLSCPQPSSKSTTTNKTFLKSPRCLRAFVFQARNQTKSAASTLTVARRWNPFKQETNMDIIYDFPPAETSASRTAAAWHESGHAVVAELFDFRVKYVSIVPSGDCVGNCQLDITPDGGAFPLLGAPRALCYVGQVLSGVAVEYIRGTLPLDCIPSSDASNLRPLLSAIAAHAHRHPRQVFENLMEMTIELVAQERIWGSIERVAEMLLARDVIDGAEVREVVARAGIKPVTEAEQVGFALALSGASGRSFRSARN